MAYETENSLARKRAEANGEKRYWTGIPCKKGHIAYMVTVSGTCSECRNINMQAHKARCQRKKYEKKEKRKFVLPIEQDDLTISPEMMKKIIPGARVYLCGKRVL